MAIVKDDSKSGSNSSRKWSPSHTWEVTLECGIVEFRPASKMIDNVVNPDSIGNMLRNCCQIEENSVGNYTVLFEYQRKGTTQIKVTGFLQACDGVDAEAMHAYLSNLQPGDVCEPMSMAEMENQWAA